jgi:cytochrome c-type biogenesis protein CcmH/NrfG
VLLDQKRTKRIVQVVAVLTSIAFAGVIFVVLGLIIFGGGSSAESQLLEDAQAAVEREPRNPDAWDALASAHLVNEQPREAVAAARRAVKLAPDDLDRSISLATYAQQAGDQAASVQALEAYTRAHPRDAQGFFQLGQFAERAGRIQLAQLSYQTFLRLAPDDPDAASVRERLQDLRAGPTSTVAP